MTPVFFSIVLLLVRSYEGAASVEKTSWSSAAVHMVLNRETLHVTSSSGRPARVLRMIIVIRVNSLRHIYEQVRQCYEKLSGGR